MYKRIAVGTDGSETADRAVEAAAGLARALRAQLHIITAFRPERSGMAQQSGAPLVDSGAGHALRAEAAKQVGEKAVSTWAGGITAQHHAVAGDAADVILDTSESLGADLIVVGNKGMRGARRYLGSVPNTVAHAAHCAVLVVKTA